jgi:hypothetical protein
MKRTVILAGFLILGAAALPLAGAAAGPIPATATGVWEVTPQPEPNNCLPPGPPMANLTTFSQDGTLINVDPLLGTAVGRVSKGPQQTFYSTFFGTTFVPDLGGILRYEVNGVSSIGSNDDFLGTFVTTLTFPNGDTCTFEGVVTGQRLLPAF